MPTTDSETQPATDNQNIHRFAVILAGGSGTRLWPLSRSAKPKQLLALNGDETLLQQTTKRLLPLVTPQNIVTVVHQDYQFEVAGQLLAVSPALADNLLIEPIGRNTLPAIAWASATIHAKDPEALIGVFSSDHAIANQEEFEAVWLSAESAAAEGFISLFGMTPDHPATGYGYIHAQSEPIKPLQSCQGFRRNIHEVVKFTEKPDEETARTYLQQGGYYWNGGIFVFRAIELLDRLAQFQPEIHQTLNQLMATPCKSAKVELYQHFPDLSIDYGLLENSDKVAVVPANIGWSDLGNWEAIYQQLEKDKTGNLTHGDILNLDSKDNLLWSDHGVLATLGIQNLAVIQTQDATLVCSRNRAQDIKNIVSLVKIHYPELAELHKTVTRPWGSYTILEEGPHFKVKRIVVNPGAKLSMQMHYHRAEHWVVISGTAKVSVGEAEIYLEANQSTYISKTQKHRLENPGRIPVEIIEIQSGQYLGEDDIVRFDDIYGRINTL